VWPRPNFSPSDFDSDLLKLLVTATSSSHKLRLILALLAILIGGLLVWALAVDDGTPVAVMPSGGGGDAAPVVAMQAVSVRDDVAVEVVGSGLAARSVTIFPATSGEVARVLFSAGQRVKQYQVLVQLVDRNERLAVELTSTRTDAARRLLQRYERTRGTGAVSANVIDEARLALRQAEIELAQAREQLHERSVRAPFDGVVGIARVDPGDRVAPDTVLTTLDDRSTLSVAFQIPEPFLARLETGQSVALHNIAFPGRRFEGRLSHIDSRIDPLTRSVGVRASVANGEDLLRPGMSFSVRLALPGAPAIQVPELAVQWGREGSHVWVVREGVAVRVPVRVVRRVEGAVLVDGEIRAGEAVVAEGFHRLRPERRVRVVQLQETGAQTEHEAMPQRARAAP
jgi:membrane fusion protein, multidrug efflux system